MAPQCGLVQSSQLEQRERCDPWCETDRSHASGQSLPHFGNRRVSVVNNSTQVTLYTGSCAGSLHWRSWCLKSSYEEESSDSQVGPTQRPGRGGYGFMRQKTQLLTWLPQSACCEMLSCGKYVKKNVASQRYSLGKGSCILRVFSEHGGPSFLIFTQSQQIVSSCRLEPVHIWGNQRASHALGRPTCLP